MEQAAAAAEAAQKDCAAWKAKYEAALDRCNQAEFKVHCLDAAQLQQQVQPPSACIVAYQVVQDHHSRDKLGLCHKPLRTVKELHEADISVDVL